MLLRSKSVNPLPSVNLIILAEMMTYSDVTKAKRDKANLKDQVTSVTWAETHRMFGTKNSVAQNTQITKRGVHMKEEEVMQCTIHIWVYQVEWIVVGLHRGHTKKVKERSHI